MLRYHPICCAGTEGGVDAWDNLSKKDDLPPSARSYCYICLKVQDGNTCSTHLLSLPARL